MRAIIGSIIGITGGIYFFGVMLGGAAGCCPLHGEEHILASLIITLVGGMIATAG